jgi:peptide/nickel transport system substrate-binding protein
MLPKRLNRVFGNRATRILATTALITSLVLLTPYTAAAQRHTLLTSRTAAAQHRVAAPFVDSGTMTLVGDGLATDIDPANNESEFGDTVVRNVDEDLIRLAGSTLSSYEPDLATSWSHNADKSVWTFHLRHGVRFHTGRCCMTADDVRYSLARSVAAGLAGSYMLGRFLTKPFQQIKVLDTYTVQFDLGSPQPIFLGAIAQDYNAMILDARAVRAHRTKSDPYAHDWVSLHDVGTGPYMVQSWVHGQQVVLTRFPGYWAGWSGPHFSRIILRNVPDATTRRELMERSQADLTLDLTPQDYDALKHNPRVRVIAPYATQVIYITMSEGGPLASRYARQALSYAFNYDALIKGVYRGYAKRAYGPIPSTVLGYDPHMFHYQTDLAKAKALLQKAGVKPGTVLTYATTPAFPFPQMGQILYAQLAQIGITLKIQQLESSAFNDLFYGTEPLSKRPNLMPYSWWPDYNDPYDMAVTLIASWMAPPAGSNGGMYHNKEVDALLNQMRNADREVIIRDAKKLQDITGRVDPPDIWACEPAQATVLASTLQGYVFNPVELRTYYFYTMYRS